jgi:hypothetical protein
MNFNRIAAACTLTTLVAIAGCASDPGKKVNAAEAELTGDKQKAGTEERDTNAEATSKNEGAHAESAADKNAATTDAKTDLRVAHADLEQDRRDFGATTKERLAKIDAKAKELKTKSVKLTGKKAADFKAHYASFLPQRDAASTRVSSLQSTTSDAWSAAKTDVEKKLEGLEGTLTGMESDL